MLKINKKRVTQFLCSIFPSVFNFTHRELEKKIKRNFETSKLGRKRTARNVSKRFVRQNVLDSKTTGSTLEERERAAAINEIAAA